MRTDIETETAFTTALLIHIPKVASHRSNLHQNLLRCPQVGCCWTTRLRLALAELECTPPTDLPTWCLAGFAAGRESPAQSCIFILVQMAALNRHRARPDSLAVSMSLFVIIIQLDAPSYRPATG